MELKWPGAAFLRKKRDARQGHPAQPLTDVGTILNEDFRDFIAELLEAGAEFLVVGAYALAFHQYPRSTGDINVWIRSDPANARRVWTAMVAFGAPVEALDLSVQDLEKAETMIRLGLAPRRIDVLTSIDGPSFDDAWPNREFRQIDTLLVPIIGREVLIANKRASGRLKDLADVAVLEDLEGRA